MASYSIKMDSEALSFDFCDARVFQDEDASYKIMGLQLARRREVGSIP